MRLLLFVAILVAAAGYYFFGGRTMTAEAVDEYYDLQYRATMTRDPDVLCNLLADDFIGVSETVIGGQRVNEIVDKKKACESSRSFYEDIKRLGAAQGGMLRLGFHRDIGSVSISDDKKTATVNASYKMTVSGRLMTFEGTDADTLIRKRGRVYLLRSESTTTVETR